MPLDSLDVLTRNEAWSFLSAMVRNVEKLNRTVLLRPGEMESTLRQLISVHEEIAAARKVLEEKRETLVESIRHASRGHDPTAVTKLRAEVDRYDLEISRMKVDPGLDGYLFQVVNNRVLEETYKGLSLIHI